MTKRILSILVAISLMFALASIGMAKSSSDDIIVSATKEMIFDKKITASCRKEQCCGLSDDSADCQDHTRDDSRHGSGRGTGAEPCCLQ